MATSNGWIYTESGGNATITDIIVNDFNTKFGTGSLKLDGTGDYIDMPDSADFNFGTNDFTIDFWVNFSVLPTSFVTFMSQSGGTSYLQLYINPNGGHYDLALFDGTNIIIKSSSTFGTLSKGTWYHIAYVRNGNDFEIFINGTSLGTTTSTATLNDHTGTFQIGRYTGGTQYVNGFMDEIRISDNARWTTSFSTPTAEYSSDANTKLLIHCNGSSGDTTFTDSSSSAHTITAYGNAQVETSYFGTSSTPTIPTTLDGFNVIAIADGAMENKSLDGVTIGHTVNLIGDAIANNGAMTVNINGAVTTSGVSAASCPFRLCTIGNNLTIGSTPTSIPTYLFYNAGVSSLTIPSNITSIRDNAFNSNSISSITFDNAVELYNDCFRNNGAISITLNTNITTNLSGSASYPPFNSCTIGNNLTIAEGVTAIASGLFASCGLTSVNLPSTLTTIGTYSFATNSLTALTIPSSVTVIDDNAFKSNSIASLTLDNAVDLGDNCFYLNSGMAVTIGANITTSRVSTYTSAPFEGCAIGTGLTISSGVTTIPNYLFAESGITQVTFPSTVTTLGTYVLYNNDNLDTIIFEAQETVTFGANILNGSQPSPKGTIYGYDSSVETWASGESIPTYYDFSYNVPGSSTYITNFSSSMYNSSKFSKVLDFLA